MIRIRDIDVTRYINGDTMGSTNFPWLRTGKITERFPIASRIHRFPQPLPPGQEPGKAGEWQLPVLRMVSSVRYQVCCSHRPLNTVLKSPDSLRAFPSAQPGHAIAKSTTAITTRSHNLCFIQKTPDVGRTCGSSGIFPV